MATTTGPTTSDFGLVGPAAVGQRLTTPWLPGSWELTQGWGPSSYSLEPEGHGFAHWHAGADIGCDCGTPIYLPHNWAYVAQAVYLDNPGGYGTGLILKVSTAGQAYRAPSRPVVDIYLGHLRQRIAPNGSYVVAGQELAISNNTGNSTGCHLHFEVRKPGGRYGTDIDPATWVLAGSTSLDTFNPQNGPPTTDQNPYNAITQTQQFIEWEAQHLVQPALRAAGNELLGIAQAGLGSVIMGAGLVLTGYGLRGQGLTDVVSRGRGLLQHRQAAGEAAAGKGMRQADQEQAGNRRYFQRSLRQGRSMEPKTRQEIAADRRTAVGRNRMRQAEPPAPVSRVRPSHQRAALKRLSAEPEIPF